MNKFINSITDNNNLTNVITKLNQFINETIDKFNTNYTMIMIKYRDMISTNENLTNIIMALQQFLNTALYNYTIIFDKLNETLINNIALRDIILAKLDKIMQLNATNIKQFEIILAMKQYINDTNLLTLMQSRLINGLNNSLIDSLQQMAILNEFNNNITAKLNKLISDYNKLDHKNNIDNQSSIVAIVIISVLLGSAFVVIIISFMLNIIILGYVWYLRRKKVVPDLPLMVSDGKPKEKFDLLEENNKSIN